MPSHFMEIAVNTRIFQRKLSQGRGRKSKPEGYAESVDGVAPPPQPGPCGAAMSVDHLKLSIDFSFTNPPYDIPLSM